MNASVETARRCQRGFQSAIPPKRCSARQRDFRLFQRDTLLRLGDEIVEAAIETWDRFVKIRNSQAPLQEKPFEAIDVCVRKIAADVVRLRLIGAHDTSQRCIELRDAIWLLPCLVADEGACRQPERRDGHWPRTQFETCWSGSTECWSG
jgi:hypothetical protein